MDVLDGDKERRARLRLRREVGWENRREREWWRVEVSIQLVWGGKYMSEERKVPYLGPPIVSCTTLQGTLQSR